MDEINERSFQVKMSSLPMMLECVECWGNSFLPQAKGIRLLLAAEEALVNIILYAYPNDNDSEVKYIILRYRLNQEQLTLEIEDTGIAFDPLAEAEYTVNRDIDSATPGGFGRVFLQRFVNEVKYIRKDDKNILQLMVHR